MNKNIYFFKICFYPVIIIFLHNSRQQTYLTLFLPLIFSPQQQPYKVGSAERGGLAHGHLADFSCLRQDYNSRPASSPLPQPESV